MKNNLKPKMVFFHDNKFLKVGHNRYFAATGYTNSLFKRYLCSFSSVTVVNRYIEQDERMERAKYDEINISNIHFSCIKKLSVFSLFFGQDRKHIAKKVAASDIAVIRLPSIIGIVATYEARRQHKPYAIEMVACPWDSLWYYGKLRYKLVAPILFVANRVLVYGAPNVLYITQSFLQRRYPTKGNSVACSDVEVGPTNDRVLSQRLDKTSIYENDHVYRIGTVAAVNMKYKGHKYVIQAMSDLVRSGYKLEYYLVGSGPQDYLKKIAKKRGVENLVHFVGPLPHHEIQHFMSGIDIYIQPSNAEALGRVILEAFEAACPVLGSSAGGISELVDTNFVFRRRSTADLKLKIKTMIDEHSTFNQQALRNYQELEKYRPLALELIRQSFYSTIANHDSVR